jgi:hypothetical protein
MGAHQITKCRRTAFERDTLTYSSLLREHRVGYHLRSGVGQCLAIQGHLEGVFELVHSVQCTHYHANSPDRIENADVARDDWEKMLDER